MDTPSTPTAARFERLLAPHLPDLLRFAYRLTHSQPDAEDLLQDVLLRLYPRQDEIEALETPRSWLKRVLYNRFVDDRRRYARRRLVDVTEAELPGASIADLADGVTSPAAQAETQDSLRRALDQLSDEQRSIVLLHDAEGYKLTEIEAATGIPVGTVKSRLHRARARLRELLADE